MYDVMVVIFMGLGGAKRWGVNVISLYIEGSFCIGGMDPCRHHECSNKME